MPKEFINSHYYLMSVVLIVISFGIFIIGFEKRKPQAREIVTLAVMSAIAVVSRAAFIMVPHFKPITAIVMITGMAFGSGAGFLTGAVSAFVSNFIFGQGPWTPWQMFAYALAGFIFGCLKKKGIVSESKKIQTAICGAAIVILVVGPILDTCSIFTMGNVINKGMIKAIYLSGLPVNAVHAVATFLTLFFLCKPMVEKLNRIKVKYGMMSEGFYEI